MYTRAVQFWVTLKKELTVAMEVVQSRNTRIWTVFWGYHQRFFRYLCMSLKVHLWHYFTFSHSMFAKNVMKYSFRFQRF